MATRGATCIAADTPARRNWAATNCATSQESISQPQMTNDAVAATGPPSAIATPTTTASILEPRAAGARPAPSSAMPATPDTTAIIAIGVANSAGNPWNGLLASAAATVAIGR